MPRVAVVATTSPVSELYGKQLQLLKELAPRAARIAVIHQTSPWPCI
jgi:hypothetical protein